MRDLILRLGLGTWISAFCLASSVGAQEFGTPSQVKSGQIYQQAEAQRSLAMVMAKAFKLAASTGRGNFELQPNSMSKSAQDYAIPAGIDALDGSDAPIYRLNNGSKFRVSGGMIGTAGGPCIAHCPRH